MPRGFAILLILLGPALTSCSRAPALFNEQNARAHVGMLAGTIGSRPAGTPANARARDYIVEQLRLYGYEVRVQEMDARRAELGLTARVANIIAVKAGSRQEAVGLVSHYDSRADTPGAGDDGFGVAVSLEAARVLAARADGVWSVMVLVTDGEEVGLMGAAGLMTDRDVRERLHTYVNVESIGAAGPVMLFENGPGNAWLVGPWARSAPHPHGTSFGIEVYRRLPSDTDFSVLKRQDIPGLNFAAVGDSYAYHTPRDTAERLSPRAIRETGENVVAIVSALDRADITQRSSDQPTYFDLAGMSAWHYGPGTARIAAVLALVAGFVAWLKVTRGAIAIGGVWRWILTLVWTAAGAALVVASMVGTTSALRAAREVYHPWYARPDRLFLLLVAVGLAVAWGIARLGRWLPARAHGVRHPLMTWSAALPAWLVMAALCVWFAPGAAYLWVLPLLTAGVLLAIAPASSQAAVRAVSVVVLAVAAVLWLPLTVDLLRFVVAIFGRLPVITPAFVYATFIAAAGLALVPPFVAATVRVRPLVQPALMTALLLTAVAVTAGLAYVAPAYTFEEPLRRVVRAVQETADGPASWDVASIEPGLDLGPGAPGGWALAGTPPATGASVATVPRPRLPYPFVFSVQGPPLGPPPVTLANASIAPLAEGVELTINAIPQQAGLTISISLPQGVSPARANLPGVERLGRWTAAYAAVPQDGLRFRASFTRLDAPQLRDTRLLVTSSRFPGGEGWQGLPAWLPQERTVWTAAAVWILDPLAAAPIAPVPPLR